MLLQIIQGKMLILASVFMISVILCMVVFIWRNIHDIFMDNRKETGMKSKIERRKIEKEMEDQ